MEAGSDKCLTPSLIDTILKNRESLFEQLVSSHCCDVDKVYYDSCLTALDIAAQNNRLWMVKRLLEAGADVKKAKHALWYAVWRSNCEMVLALTRAGADVNVCINYTGDVTPLFHRAVKLGSLEICRTLLEAGADPNAKTDRGFHVLSSPPLPQNGFKQLLKLLIDFGFDVNATDWKGYSTMHTVMERSARLGPDTSSQYVKILLDADARCDDQSISGDTPLLLAIQWGTLDLVRTLVTAGADPNISNKWNTTPLCVAVRRGAVDIVRYLVSLNVDLEVPSLEKSFLRSAASRIQQSATLNQLTPLFYAMIGQHLEIIEVLIEAGYDIWRERWQMTGALTVAYVYSGCKEIKKVENRVSEICRTVPTLQHVCKMVIRKTYQTGLSERLRSLVLPSAIKKYLLLDGIENHNAQNNLKTETVV